VGGALGRLGMQVLWHMHRFAYRITGGRAQAGWHIPIVILEPP
jgi:hypothetical protein